MKSAQFECNVHWPLVNWLGRTAINTVQLHVSLEKGFRAKGSVPPAWLRSVRAAAPAANRPPLRVMEVHALVTGNHSRVRQANPQTEPF